MMSDRFDQLSLPAAEEGLDPVVRARVLADVRRLLAEPSSAPILERPDPRGTFEDVEVVMNESPEPPRWRGVALVLAAVAAVAVLVVVLVPRSGADDVESPSGASATAATSATTAAPSTSESVPVKELTDEDIARAMVLPPAEYAPNWSSIGENSNPIRLDAARAATHAECAGFVDVAFEGPQRPAAVVWNSFTYGPPIENGAQYIVVLPDEAAAIAMFDAANDPRFINECRPAYIGPEVACCVDASVDFWPNSVGFTPEEDAFEHVGDQSVFVDREFTWTDENGQVVGPETEYLALLRVGRAIISIEAVGIGREGVEVTSHADFQKAMNNVVVRARAALAGSPLPRD